MKFLIDAQLPQRLSAFLSSKGLDCKHTLDLPDQNTTTDQEIIKIADEEDRIVISKDSDFLDNYILDESPKQLLIVTTGNIGNNELIRIFKLNIETLVALFEDNNVIEIDEEEIQVHY